MALALDPTVRRRLTIGLGVGTVVLGAWLWLRSDDHPPAPTSDGEAPAAAQAHPVRGPADQGAPAAAEAQPDSLDPAQPAALPRDCAELAERAMKDDDDAVLLAWLCPDRPLDALTARAALLAVRSPDEAAALAPRLADHPALRGLAELVAQARVPPRAGPLPDPARAVVSPVDDEVLARVQQAHGLIAEPGLPLAERTRARAYVAKVYLQATQQLGVTVGRAPEPFARLLSGRALHYGRLFCLSYWRNRVAGLAPLFGEIETHLLELTLALESGAPEADAGRLAVELWRAREYLQGDGPRSRIERRLELRTARPWGPERLLPVPNEIERLLAHGFVDLAIDRALAQGRRPDGPGLAAVEQLLRDDLARTERGESRRRLEQRFERERARSGAPAEQGPGQMEHAAEPPWVPAPMVADEAAELIARAPDHGLARGYALGRALLRLRDRPDALVLLLDRATDSDPPPALALAIAWLDRELAARDVGRRAWLQRRVAADAALGPRSTHEDEAARRRAYALRVREADRLPRGPGLGRSTDAPS